jgi:sugar phosphate isomerase/epimerase
MAKYRPGSLYPIAAHLWRGIVQYSGGLRGICSIVGYDLLILEETRVRRLFPFLVIMLLSSPVSGQKSSGKIRIGVCIDLDKLAAAQEAGFDYVELSVSRVAALTNAEFDQLARQVAALRIPASAANTFLPGNLKIVGPQMDKDRQIDYVTRALSRMKTLGVGVVVLGSGGSRRVPEGFPRDEALGQLADFCRRIAPIARDNGIVIAVEPLRHQETNLINTVREGLSFVKGVDLPQIKLQVDYYHLAEENEDAKIILEAGTNIVHTHIANPHGRVFPLSPDESNYAPFFENLCKIGYSGCLSVEAATTDFASQAPRSIAMLRQGLACPIK